MWGDSEKKIKEIVGAQIDSVEIDTSQQHYLRFKTDKGFFVLEAEGDCCSESWFADLTGVSSMIGYTVIDFEAIPMPEVEENDTRTRQDVDCQYGYKVITTGGHAQIVYRNSSNGYYGGWLNVVDQIPLDVEMVVITDDYSA